VSRRAPALALAVTAALTLMLASCSSPAAPSLAASGAFIPEPVSESVAGGFLVLTNSGGEDDTLTGVTSDLAETVELHETVDNAMRPVESFPVPAGGTLELTRGGNHLMLRGLSRKPEPGEEIALELHFEKSDTLILHVPVEAATHTGR
jgi:periplasmic copper chaperone A